MMVVEQIIVLTVQNRGDGVCPPGAALSDPLPEAMRQVSPIQLSEGGGEGGWQCESRACVANGGLAPGYAANLPFSVMVAAGTIVENCAQIGVVGDVEPTNDTSCITLGPFPTPTSAPAACLYGLDKAIRSSDVVSVTPGRAGTLRIRVQNAGPEGCMPRWPELVVTNALPPGMSLRTSPEASDPRWECRDSAQVFQCAGPPPRYAITVTVSAELVLLPGAEQAQNCAVREPIGVTACALPSDDFLGARDTA